MLSIVGLADKDIEDICAQALAQAPAESICQMANFLFPQVRLHPACTTCVNCIASLLCSHITILCRCAVACRALLKKKTAAAPPYAA